MKKVVLRNFPKFTVKHLCQSLFFNKVAGLRLKIYTVLVKINEMMLALTISNMKYTPLETQLLNTLRSRTFDQILIWTNLDF